MKSTLTHFHPSPILTVNGMVSVVCWIQLLCPEVVSYESQVLGKNHASTGLRQNTLLQKLRVTKKMVCEGDPHTDSLQKSMSLQLERWNVMNINEKTRTLAHYFTYIPVILPSIVIMEERLCSVQHYWPAEQYSTNKFIPNIVLEIWENKIRISFSWSHKEAAKTLLSYRGLVLIELAVKQQTDEVRLENNFVVLVVC